MTADEIVARLVIFPPLQRLSPEELAHLAGEVREETHPAGAVLFRQGEPARAFFILASGYVEEVGLDAAGHEVIRRHVGAGEALGHTAILLGIPHTTTATALSPVCLLALSSQALSWLLTRRPELKAEFDRAHIVGRLRAFPCFRSLPDDVLIHLADLVQPVCYQAGERIAAPEDLARALYLIDTGQAAVEYLGPEGSRREVLTAGNFFGASAVLRGDLPQRARARTDLSLLRLSDADLRRLLDVYPSLRDDLQPPDIVGRLRATPLFSGLTARQLAILAGYVAWHYYPAGRLVTVQGEPGAHFLILDEGEAVARGIDAQGRERPYAYFRAGQAFGETSLFLGDARDASIEAVSPTTWLALHRLDFQLCLAAHPDIRPRLRLRPEVQERLRYRRFRWQESGEIILFWARRHWFFLAKRVTVPLGIFLLLMVLLGMALGWRASAWLEEVLALAGGLALLAIGWIALDWANDYFAVSNRRITHFERVLLVSETRREAPLDKVQDINIVRGVLGNLLGFGDLTVQTAATVGKIAFDHLAAPEQVQEVIFAQVARVRANAHAASRGMIRRGLEHRLGLGLEPLAPPRALPDSPSTSPAAARPWWAGLRLWPRLRWVQGDRITWRKHWMNLLMRTIHPLLLSGLSLVGMTAAAAGWGPFSAPTMRAPAFLALLLLFLAFFAWLWWNYEDWQNDIYVVTSERIIDIEKKPLFFAENRREASLAVVQNVSLHIPGPLAYILNYGDVIIQTAAETGAFNFRFVANPREVQNEVFRRIEAYRQREALRRAEERRAELLEWFGEYNRLQGGRHPAPDPGA